MQSSFFKSADLKFGLGRNTDTRRDGKYGLLVLEMRGVESEEACKGVTILDHDLDAVTVALYRAAYYDAMKEAAGSFTEETSHVQYVTERLRHTRKVTPMHWRLGMDARLTLEVFGSQEERRTRKADIRASCQDVEMFTLFRGSPPLMHTSTQEYKTFIRLQSSFEQSYTQGACLVTMSAEQICLSVPPSQLRRAGDVNALFRKLVANGGDVSLVRQTFYDEHDADFRQDLELEAGLLGALTNYLLAIPVSSSDPSAAGATAVINSSAKPTPAAVPSPYCELAREEHCSVAQLVNSCKTELSRQGGNHMTAMAVIFNRRHQLTSQAFDEVLQEYEDAVDNEEYGEEERLRESETSCQDDYRKLKKRARAALENSGGDSFGLIEIFNDCFLVALLDAMKMAVELFNAALSNAENAHTASAAVTEKRKTPAEEGGTIQAGPGPKKAKQ